MMEIKNEFLKKMEKLADKVKEREETMSEVIDYNCTRHGRFKAQRKSNGVCDKCIAEDNQRRLTAQKWADLRYHIGTYYEGTIKRHRKSRFCNWKPQTEKQQRIKEALKNYADNHAENFRKGKNIILVGNVGTGKTHLAHALKWELSKNYRVYYTKFSELYSLRIKAYFQNEYLQKLEDIYKKNHFLILDEMGIKNEKDGDIRFIFELIDYRYDNMLPTILISNKNAHELTEVIGYRVVDRLRENGGLLLNITGPSNRN